jgi:hypothetical protein
MDPGEAERRFAELLEQASLPRFDSAVHDASLDELQLFWEHGFAIHLDLTRHDLEPIDDWERAGILGQAPGCCDPAPPLHPDDVTTLHGLRITTPSRTLIDLAEVMTADQLRAAFARAREIGLLDPDALRASRARVEWRPSLAMLDAVIEEFCG